MKKRLKSTLALTLAVALLTGCASGAVSSTVASSAGTASGATLSVAAKQDWVKDIDRELAQKFEEETGIQIDFQVVPNDQYDNVIKAKLASGEAPDVFYGDSGLALKNYFPEKYCADLTEEAWVARYTDSTREGCSVGGKVYALNTWASDPWAIMYDSQLFEKLDIQVPTNWDEFMKVCETLKENGVIPMYEDGKDTWHVPGFIKNSGSIIERNNPGAFAKISAGEAKLADYPEFELAFARLKEMYDKGYFAEDVLSETWGNQEEALASGKYGMMLVWSSFCNEIVAKFPEAGPVDRWKMFSNPLYGNLTSVEVSTGGIVRMINKDSKNLEAAKQYLAWCTEEENLKTYYDARPDLAAIKPFADMADMPTNPALESYLALGTDGQFVALESNVDYLNGDLIAKGIQEMMLGVKTPAEIVESIDADREKTLATINQ